MNHVGIAVSNLEEGIALYQALFDSPETSITEAPEMGLRAAIIIQGATHIELLQSTQAGNAIGKFLTTHGEGLHHIAFNVENVDEKVAQLKKKGIDMIDDVPRQGLTGRIAFIHPKATLGALIELVQPPNKDRS
jgi:methylmalonyl-CoA epimerase